MSLATAAPSRPLYGPWNLGTSPSGRPPAPRAGTSNTYSAAGQRFYGSPEPPDSKPTSSGFSPFRQS